MTKINVRGVEHYYQWIRQSDDQHKPVIVFIHGWGGSARYWHSTAQALSDDFDCLLYDLRGFGRSLMPSSLQNSEVSYELEDYAEDLAAFLDSLSLETVLSQCSLDGSLDRHFLPQPLSRTSRASHLNL